MAEKSFAERLWEGIDEALKPYDAPEEFVENLKQDFKSALGVKAKARPGYEPGAVTRVGFNLVDFVTQPGKTAWKTISKVWSERSRPPVPLLWTDAESAVWNKFFIDPTIGWVDAAGNPVVPSSLRQATLRWNEGARIRGARLVREQKGILENPGLTLMMAQRLNYYYASLPGAPAPMVAGVMLPQVISDARRAEQEITHLLGLADNAERIGDHAEAVRLWDEATKRQGDWAELSKSYRDALRKEFERVSRMGEAGVSYAAQQLANSPEAQFWRYWKNRRLYFQTLNFLNTFREEGFWGGIREYVWEEFTKRVFAENTWHYWLYPPNVINEVLGRFAKKVRLTALLNKITEARAWFARLWKRFIKNPATKIFEFIRDKIVRRFVGWLASKLSLTGLSALIGSVVPGAGTAVGAVIGAVASFIGGIIAEKMMKPVLKATAYLFAGACGCLALAVAGTAMFIVLVVGSVLAPGAPGGAPGPPLPPVARVTVKKESCIKKIIGGVETWLCQNPRTIGNNTGTWEIKWQITITNGSGQEATVSFSDEECGQTWEYTLAAGEQRTPNCTKNYNTNNPTLHNTTVTNSVTGTATVGGDTLPLSAMGILNIGTPPHTFPSGWPTSGIITQGPNVPCPSHGSAEAIDIANVVGTPVYATHSGEVAESGWINSSCGNGVRITATVGTSTFTSQYCHLSRVDVSEGEVTGGQPIGLMGSTGDSSGSHLHYSFIGLPMAPPYIPQAVCCCREDLDGDGSWKDEDAQYCGSSGSGTVRCNATVSH